MGNRMIERLCANMTLFCVGWNYREGIMTGNITRILHISQGGPAGIAAGCRRDGDLSW